MAKITGKEPMEQLPAKAVRLYRAVAALIEEGADVGTLRVAQMTERAGIGKGTAYDYFDTREEIIVYALIFFMEEQAKKLEEEIEEKENFAEKMELCLDVAGSQMQKGACLLCLINLLLESSEMGTLFRKILEERKKAGICQPELTCRKIIEKGILGGEIRRELPVDYMVYILLTKLAAYMVFMFHRQSAAEQNGTAASDKPRLSAQEFRGCILQGILEEFQAE